VALLDDLSAALQGAVDFTFSDTVLVAAGGTKVSNGAGGWTTGPANHDCRAKLDKKETRDSDGGLIIVTRILILRGSLAVTPTSGNLLQGLDREYKLGKCHSDGLGSHWVCEVENG
jgi:hypothetical protein